MRRHIPALALAVALCWTGPASARGHGTRAVVLVEAAPADPTTAALARALRPHLSTADATLRVVPGQPPGDDDIARAAWGAETAARERADVVLWLDEAGEDDGLTLHLVDARARVSSSHADEGRRFDQVRALAIDARSHVVRAIERVAREATAAPIGGDASAGTSLAAPTLATHRIVPLGTFGPIAQASDQGLAGGARAEMGFRVRPHLDLRLGAEVLLPEARDSEGGTVERSRVPFELSVAGTVPVGALRLSAGIDGGLTLAFLQKANGTIPRTRIAATVGVHGVLRMPLVRSLFVELPLRLRVRVAAPGSEATYTQEDVAPAFEAGFGVVVGLGG